MAYADWKKDFERMAGGDPVLIARLWNLENETRVVPDRAKFKRLVGRLHKRHMQNGLSPPQAARQAFDDAITETRPVDSPWLGKLASSPRASLPKTVVTYLPSDEVAKNRPEVRIRPKSPPRTVKLNPLKTRAQSGTVELLRRFVWVTWGTSGELLPDNPNEVKRQLGLAHFRKGRYIYRCPLQTGATGSRRFVPTCLDAGLNEAWMPTPPGFPQCWGRTRDLTTGHGRWPELLVEASDYVSIRHDAELVGDGRTPIGEVEIDFMAGRE